MAAGESCTEPRKIKEKVQSCAAFPEGSGLSTESFLHGIRRAAQRRTLPIKSIRSQHCPVASVFPSSPPVIVNPDSPLSIGGPHWIPVAAFAKSRGVSHFSCFQEILFANPKSPSGFPAAAGNPRKQRTKQRLSQALTPPEAGEQKPSPSPPQAGSLRGPGDELLHELCPKTNQPQRANLISAPLMDSATHRPRHPRAAGVL